MQEIINSDLFKTYDNVHLFAEKQTDLLGCNGYLDISCIVVICQEQKFDHMLLYSY